MRNLPIWLSGADAEVLAYFPGDRARYSTLGSVILVTGTLAMVSMWFALHMALRVTALAAIPFALAWGVGIISIDRMLVVSMQRAKAPVQQANQAQQKKRGYLIWLALPRLLLALLLGIVISTPVTLQIFAQEIDTQIQVIHQNNLDTFRRTQATKGIGKDIKALEADIAQAQQTIANGTTDPKLAALNKTYATDLAKSKADYQEWRCQLYGGPGCPSIGNGVLAQAARKSYLNDQDALKTDLSNINQESTQSGATVAQATADLATYNSKLSADQSKQAQEEKDFNAKNSKDAGLLIRLQALDDLTAGNANLQLTRWALFLLFVMFELLPVLTKIFQSTGDPTSYELGLAKVDKQRYDDLPALVADADRLNSAKSDAWENVRPQVVAQYKADYQAMARNAAPASGLPGRDGKWPRMPRWRSAPPSAAASGPVHLVPLVTARFLRKYRPPSGVGQQNGHEPSSASGTGP